MTEIQQYSVRHVELSTLIPYADNPKIHDEEQIDILASRIIKEGFNQPIVVDVDNVIVKGHGRRLAAKKLDLTHVPVIVLSDLSPAEVKAARIADNVVAQRTEYDKSLMMLELEQLKELDILMEDVGLDDMMLNKLDLLEPEDREATEPLDLSDELDTKHECPMCKYKW